jgi:hypothetical protein
MGRKRSKASASRCQIKVLMYDFRGSQPEKAGARGYFSALSNSRRSKPIDGHSIASDLATNASGGIQADAAGGPRDVVEAWADGQTARVRRRGHHLKAALRGLPKDRRSGTIHRRPDTP